MRTHTIIAAALTVALLAITAAPSTAGVRIRFDRSALRDLAVGIPPRLIDREAIERAISETNSLIADEANEALLDIADRTDQTIAKIQEMHAAGMPLKLIKRTIKLDRRLIKARANQFSIDSAGIAGEGVAAVRLAGGTGEDEWDIRWTNYHAQESIYGAAKDARRAIKTTLKLAKQGLLPPPLGTDDESGDNPFGFTSW